VVYSAASTFLASLSSKTVKSSALRSVTGRPDFESITVTEMRFAGKIGSAISRSKYKKRHNGGWTPWSAAGPLASLFEQPPKAGRGASRGPGGPPSFDLLLETNFHSRIQSGYLRGRDLLAFFHAVGDLDVRT